MEFENRKIVEKINENKTLLFIKINKVAKTLARWTEQKRENINYQTL